MSSDGSKKSWDCVPQRLSQMLEAMKGEGGQGIWVEVERTLMDAFEVRDTCLYCKKMEKELRFLR